MKFTILTLFLNMIRPFLDESVIGRSQKSGVLTVEIRDLRDWATDKHRTVDDTPYGGGPGMVLKVDIIDRALADIKAASHQDTHTILLTPQGDVFNQQAATALANSNQHVILLAGHYEGFDERVRQLVDQELSIGDFVLTGGELPAAIVIDAVARLLPGVLGNPASLHSETHSSPSPDYPTYTRPETYEPFSKPGIGKLSVPDVLKSGDHGQIATWRDQHRRPRT